MKRCLLLLFSFVALVAHSQTMMEWDDVSITSLNRIQSHDLSIPFDDVDDARSLDLSRSPYFRNSVGALCQARFRVVSMPTTTT